MQQRNILKTVKPTIARKPDMGILHTGTNDLKGNQNPSDIASEIISLAKNIKISRTKVSISSLIRRGDRLSEKEKKLTKSYKKNIAPRTLLLYYIRT